MLRYKEIKVKLLDIIGNFSANEKLPSRPDLCVTLETTRTTLDKAIRELVAEGILTSMNGSGTYVNALLDKREESNGYWGVIVPNIMESIYPGMVRGIENVAQQYGISITLCNSDNNADKQEQYIKRLMQSGVAGFIIVPVISSDVPENYRLYNQLTEAKIPFVFCNRSVEGISAPVVSSNDFYGGYIATKHLIEKGYRKIAYISRTRYKTSINRCHGYLSALMENNIDIDRSNIILEEKDSPIAGYSSMMRLLNTDPDIDAVFCFNDTISQGVYAAISDSGRRVSTDIGIIGYDNSDICEISKPRLTTLAYKNVEIGQKSAELLWKMVNHQELSEFNYYLYQPSIEVRESCLGPGITV